jgi:hypothetical protein
MGRISWYASNSWSNCSKESSEGRPVEEPIRNITIVVMQVTPEPNCQGKKQVIALNVVDPIHLSKDALRAVES